MGYGVWVVGWKVPGHTKDRWSRFELRLMMEILEMKNAWAESIHFVNNCITEIPDGTSCHDDILWFLTIQIIYTRYNPKIWKIRSSQK